MANSSNNRRQAANRFELVYSSGGTGGPYDNEDEAKKAAERLLQGGSDRWVAVIDAKDVNDLTKAKALWTLKRGGRWEKGPSPLPNVRPMDHFEATRHLRALVVETHAALSEAAPVEADFEMAGTLTRRVLGPVVDNLEKYLNDEDPKTVKVGLGMVFDALASVLDQLGQSTAATATRAARKEVRMGKA